jgi:hypothetical protein
MKTGTLWIHPNLRRPGVLVALTLLGFVLARSQAATPKVPGTSSPAYPLKVSANRRYLVDQNNIPFVIAGDVPASRTTP